MPKRLLVTEAGTGASEYLIRSLRAGDDFYIAGSHFDQFVLRNSAADRRWLVPRPSDPRFGAAIRGIVERDRIDLVIPNADATVAALSAARRPLGRRLFLPGDRVVRLCQDKYALTRFLARRGVAVPETYAVRSTADVATAFRRFRRRPLWCRLRAGDNSRGAAPVGSPGVARAWIRYWAEMRGVSARDFTLSEYLPGRDFACLMVWRDGTLVLAKTCERLSYFFAESQPSRRSSMGRLSKTVREPAVVALCERAILALDRRASGVFSVDLKADDRGDPRITEINAGRLIAQTILLDRAGKHAPTLTYARVALGEPVGLVREYDAVEDWYFLRNVDAEPLVFEASEFFDGVEDARPASGARAAAPRLTAAPGARHRFEIGGPLDRHDIEALGLEVRRLGQQLGFEISAFDATPADEPVTLPRRRSGGGPPWE